MIEQIKSSEIKKFIEKNPKTVLLDVRTEDEWKTFGKPVSGSLGIETFFITITQDPSFIDNVKKEINKDKKILVCAPSNAAIDEIITRLISNGGLLG